MEGPRLETRPVDGLEAPEAHLPSLPTWRQTGSPPAATTVDEVLVGQVPGRASGDAGQPGQEDRRRGRGEEPRATRADRSRLGAVADPEAATRPAGLDP